MNTTNDLELTHFIMRAKHAIQEASLMARAGRLVKAGDALANAQANARQAEWRVNALLRPPKGDSDAPT